MEFNSGQDYPNLCQQCKIVVNECLDLVLLGSDTDDNEAPFMVAADHEMFCGGHECSCDCSIGFPSYDSTEAILCPAPGGTEAEQQEFRARLCERAGHYFPAWTAREERDWVCLLCLKAYGRADKLERILEA